MSIEEMCTGDTVFPNARTSSIGALGGDAGTYAADASAGIECRVEEASAHESLSYSAKGMVISHLVYFSTDVALSGKHRLHWTLTDDNQVALTGIYLYVKAYYKENSPDGDLVMWIAVCEYKDTRKPS